MPDCGETQRRLLDRPAATEGVRKLSYSGIVVRVRPAALAELAPGLSELPGVRIHQQDTDSGRLVLTLEAESVDEEIEGLRQIQRFPGVISADLVYHRLPTDTGSNRPNQPLRTPDSQRGEN
jgi:nitrate reductase NapD